MRVSILAATLLTTLLSGGCSAAQDGGTVPPDHIRYAVEDGGRTTIWIAYAGGRTTYAQYDRDEQTAGSELRSPPEAFQGLLTSLAPFETAQGLNCPGQAGRRSGAELSWLRGVRTVSLSLKPACGGREIGAAFGALIAASRVTSRTIGDDQWVEVGPEAAGTVRTPVPALPASGRAVVVPASEAVDAVAYNEIGPNGAGGFQWRIDREGRGVFTSRGGAARTFSVGAEGFAQARAALKALEDLRTACSDTRDFHEPIGIWSWTRGDQTTSVRLDEVCMPPARDEANRLVMQWAGGS